MQVIHCSFCFKQCSWTCLQECRFCFWDGFIAMCIQRCLNTGYPCQMSCLWGNASISEGLCDVFGCWDRNGIEMVPLELRQPSKKWAEQFSSVVSVGSRSSVEGRHSVRNVELCFRLMFKFCVLQDDIQLFNNNCQIKGKMLATWIFHNLFQSGFYIWSQCWLSFQQSPNVNYFLTVSSSWSLLSLQMSYSNTPNSIL